MLFPAKRGGLLNLDNWRRREWSQAIAASGVARSDLRHAEHVRSNALAAGVSIFELARVAGTSVRMSERHDGARLDGAGAAIAAKLDTYESIRAEAP